MAMAYESGRKESGRNFSRLKITKNWNMTEKKLVKLDFKRIFCFYWTKVETKKMKYFH